jgi:hypothetical protein
MAFERRKNKPARTPPRHAPLQTPVVRSTISPQILWLNFDEQHFAEQLCLWEFALYQAITPNEYMNKNWSKSKTNAPNIQRLADHFNSVSSKLITKCGLGNYKGKCDNFPSAITKGQTLIKLISSSRCPIGCNCK